MAGLLAVRTLLGRLREGSQEPAPTNEAATSTTVGATSTGTSARKAGVALPLPSILPVSAGVRQVTHDEVHAVELGGVVGVVVAWLLSVGRTDPAVTIAIAFVGGALLHTGGSYRRRRTRSRQGGQMSSDVSLATLPDAVEVALDDEHFENYKQTYDDWIAFNERDGHKVHLWNVLNGLLRSHFRDATSDTGTDDDFAVTSFESLCRALKLPDSTSVDGVRWITWLGAQVAGIDEVVDLVTESGGASYDVTIGVSTETVDTPVAFIKYGRKIHDKERTLENSATNLIGYLTNDPEKIERYPETVRDEHMEQPPFRRSLLAAVDRYDFETAFGDMDYRERVKVAAVLTSGLSATRAGKEFLSTQLERSYSDGPDPVIDVREMLQPPDDPKYFYLGQLQLPGKTGFAREQKRFVNDLAALAYNFTPGALQLYLNDHDITTVGRFFGDVAYAFYEFYGLPEGLPWASYPAIPTGELEEFVGTFESGPGARAAKARQLATLGRKLSNRVAADFDGARGVASGLALVFSSVALASSVISNEEGAVTARQVMSVADSVARVTDIVESSGRSIEQKVPERLMRAPPSELTREDFFYRKTAFRFVSDVLGPLMDVVDISMSVTGLSDSLETGDYDAALVHGIGITGSSLSVAGGALGLAGTTGTLGLTAAVMTGFGAVIGIAALVLMLLSKDTPIENWAKNTYFGHNYWTDDGADLHGDPTSRYYRFKIDGEPNFARQVSEFYTLLNPLSLSDPLLAIQENESGNRYFTARVEFGTETDPVDPEGDDETPPAQGLDPYSVVVVRPIVRRSGSFAYAERWQHAIRLNVDSGARGSNWRYQLLRCDSFGSGTRVTSHTDVYWRGYFNGSARRSNPPVEEVLGIPKADLPHATVPERVGTEYDSGQYLEVVVLTPGQYLTWRKNRNRDGLDLEDMPEVRRERAPIKIKDMPTLEELQ